MSAAAIAGVRVKEKTATAQSGTGTFNMSESAEVGFQSFAAVFTSGDLVEYVIEGATAGEWEHGIGTWTSATPDTLARTTVLAGSNGTSPVNFTSGQHTVFVSPGARTLNRLTLPVVAITDAAVTMVVNRCYRGSIAAWATADRNYTLPDTAALGDRIRVELTAGNASFELVIKTAATASAVNGVDASTEWSRLFIAGECVEFVCVNAGGAGDTDWIVTYDGRKPCIGRMDDTTGTSITATPAAPSFGSTFDRGGIVDAANDRFSIRRAGRYEFQFLHTTPALADNVFASVRFVLDPAGSATVLVLTRFHIATASTSRASLPVSITRAMSAGDLVGCDLSATSNYTTETGENLRPIFICTEKL